MDLPVTDFKLKLVKGNPMNPELKRDIDHIMDVFGGADGCVGYVAYRRFMEELNGKTDAASKELIAITTRFAKFLRVAKKIMEGKR